TGAPKVRAMEIIRELEPWPRERYTGAFGFLDPRGDLELALAIRTATVSGGVVRYHAGGGIVADSDPERELAETWLKTAALRRGRPTLLLAARPLPPDLARRQSHGVSAILLPFPRDAGPPWGNLKLVGHASAVAGRLAAVRRGADEGLYVTPAGEVTEGTTTN